jgi:photosystem II stability/assembly factor-like uncharacterized protein
MSISLKLALFLPLIFSANVFADGFYSVHSPDGNQVWAVGNNGSIWKSVTAGQSWSSYILGGATYYSVFTLGTNVWIAGSGGSLQRSSNSGMSWTASAISGQTLKSIFFVDANTGWIVGNAGTILKTVNGGVNWTTQTSPVSDNLNSVKFTGVNDGVACGDGGKVIYTNNGGSTWSQYTTPTTYNLLSIDRKLNTIIAGAEYGIAIKSVNGGTSWNVINYKIDTKSDIAGVHMVDANTFYSCGGGGFIRRSDDAGSTFIYQMNPMMGNLAGIYFYNINTGWAVSSLNNAVLRTTDGGTTWLLPAGTNVQFSWVLKQSTSGNIGNGFALHPTNRNGIFIMAGNNLYRSLDRGETWALIATAAIGGSCHSFYVSPNDTNLMVASKGSSGGVVIRSTNYGQTWTTVWGPGSLTSYGMPLEMDQNNPNVLFLAPDNNVLLRSTNFGLTFSPWGSPPLTYNGGLFRSPCDMIVVYDNSNVMYLGDGTTGSGNGELFKSTNGGQNWFSIHSVSGSEIPMLAVSSHDQNLAYHTCWSSGGFWKTTSQWNNLNQIATTGSAWACDIAKDDPNSVAYGVYGQAVYISTNAGASFTSMNVGSSPEAGMLFYDKGNLLSQKGGGVYKCVITYSVPTFSGNQQISSEVPKEFALNQNYPNPFNPETVIGYSLIANTFVSLKIFDVLGHLVDEPVNESQPAGTYKLTWNGRNYSSGVYFYSLFVNGERIATKSMMLVK